MSKDIYTDEYKENLVVETLRAMGENPNREGLKDTPNRVMRMWKEIFRGYDKSQIPKVTTFMNGTDGLVTDQMVCDTGDFYSQCEHHIVPFFGRYYFAYIPAAKGKILGLSKVARIVDYYSAKLQIQERLVTEVVNHLWKALTTENGIEPVAMALVMDGEHLCKTMRGVKKKGMMRSSDIRGTIRSDVAARAEFYNWIKQNGN